jgi:hypothetical protein
MDTIDIIKTKLLIDSNIRSKKCYHLSIAISSSIDYSVNFALLGPILIIVEVNTRLI